ncbi:MAG: hypothetical protein AB1744_06970, partial [Candidatus Zixiibacteriota bacterium]
PDASDAERFAYGQIFAAEGGVAKDPTSSASGGILQATLDDARKRVPGLEGANTPSDLTLDQRAAVMRDYFDQSLRTAGGSKALENIGDRNSAAALAASAVPEPSCAKIPSKITKSRRRMTAHRILILQIRQ